VRRSERMPSLGRVDRRAAALVLLGCAVFWACALIGGAVNPGYVQSRDFLSALAGRGSEAAWLGMIGILGLAVACVAAALIWLRRNQVVAGALVLAAVGCLVGGLARLACPQGAALCHIQDGTPNTLEDTVHLTGIATFEAGMLGAMLAASVALSRRAARLSARVLVIGSVVAALGGLLALQAMTGAAPGSPQRVWALLNTAWLVVVGTAPVWLERAGARRTVDA
jgi:hypothetical membrane protein